MKIKFIFAWYDIWIGVFIDRQKWCVYIFPIPCFGIRIYRERAMMKALQAAIDEPRDYT